MKTDFEIGHIYAYRANDCKNHQDALGNGGAFYNITYGTPVIDLDIALHRIAESKASVRAMGGDELGYVFLINGHLCGESDIVAQQPTTEASDVLKVMKASLPERGDDEVEDRPVGVLITSTRHGLSIHIDGHGLCGMVNDDTGIQIFMEQYNNEVILRVCSDINREGPTHNITFERARLSNAKT
jgi:hypothetical protein